MMTNGKEAIAVEALCDVLDYAQLEIHRLIVELPEETQHLHERLTAIRAHMIAVDIELNWDPTMSPPLQYDDIYVAALAGNPGPYDHDRNEFFGIDETRH